MRRTCSGSRSGRHGARTQTQAVRSQLSPGPALSLRAGTVTSLRFCSRLCKGLARTVSRQSLQGQKGVCERAVTRASVWVVPLSGGPVLSSGLSEHTWLPARVTAVLFCAFESARSRSPPCMWVSWEGAPGATPAGCLGAPGRGAKVNSLYIYLGGLSACLVVPTGVVLKLP